MVLLRPLTTCLRVPLAAGVAAAALLVAHPGQAQAPTDDARPAQAAPATADEIRALERQVDTVLAEARRQQAQLQAQRQRLADAEAASAWLPLLGMALALLAVLSGGLGLRAWRLQRQLRALQAAARAAAAAEAPSDAARADAAFDRASERPLLGGAEATLPRRATEAPAVPVSPGAAAGLSGDGRRAPGNFGTGVPPRPVSVEELLDLDQQVEFFLALGQAQSAVDLLLGHVRSTGGTSAQPYFKLLEIYREQGDEEAYERTRERFNQRFNAHAPGWTGDLDSGRPLEDYAEVMLRLQRAWPQPLRALAELESLLLRRADLEPFDLSAYRELLMLHALVRDLPAAGRDSVDAGDGRTTSGAAAQPTSPGVLARGEPLAPLQPADLGRPAAAGVDLLLPLDDDPLDITQPQPHRASRPLAQAMLADWVFARHVARSPDADIDAAADAEAAAAGGGPTRLDLDLSDQVPAPREFTRPPAFSDIDMRRDRRLSDLGGLDEVEPLPSRR